LIILFIAPSFSDYPVYCTLLFSPSSLRHPHLLSCLLHPLRFPDYPLYCTLFFSLSCLLHTPSLTIPFVAPSSSDHPVYGPPGSHYPPYCTPLFSLSRLPKHPVGNGTLVPPQQPHQPAAGRLTVHSTKLSLLQLSSHLVEGWLIRESSNVLETSSQLVE
jgi:hypothetical protein